MPNDLSQTVLIAGGGPTGLTAALELRRFGIPVRIIDEMEGPAATSRAVGIQARTLEEMELRGLADEFVRIGHPASGGDIYGDGKLLVHVDFTRIASRYNYLLFLSQTETDRILREALEAEGAGVEWGVKLAALGQTPMGINVTLEHTGGSFEEITVPYVIDAEGAHSIIRNTLGLKFKGKTLDEVFALGDVHVGGDLSNSNFHIFSSKRGLLGMFPMGGSHFRLIAGNAHTDQPLSDPPTLEELQQIYDQRSHIPARLHQLTWSSTFRINSRMVDTMRIGRVFFAGDAAHIHSPAGGQGMNTGIQDAMNLGWKLALVLRGVAPEALLDTYDQDRLPVMRSVVSRTEGLTEMIDGDSILRSFFVHVASWVAHAEFVQNNVTARISQIALNYRSSPLSSDNFGDGSLAAGDRMPDLPVRTLNVRAGNVRDGDVRDSAGSQSEPKRIFTLLSPERFTLLLANFTDAAVQAQIAESLAPWSELMDTCSIAAPEGEGQKTFVECFGERPSITLVRPDAYIGFRGTQSSAGALSDYCKQWLSPAAQKQAA
jgi:2-polyprenyl-6-methoxyphenol hydroxylase-like FAD-dependent oxidoreductase